MVFGFLHYTTGLIPEKAESQEFASKRGKRGLDGSSNRTAVANVPTYDFEGLGKERHFGGIYGWKARVSPA